jgi:hypothetical protein
MFGNRGQDEDDGGRRIAIGLCLDLVQSATGNQRGLSGTLGRKKRAGRRGAARVNCGG